MKKRKYEKPQIKQVAIIPEEAALSACKTGPAATGLGTRNCDHAACKKSVYGS